MVTTLPRLHNIESVSAGDDTKMSDTESAKILRAITHQDFNFCLGIYDQTVMDQLQKFHTALATPARMASITNSICKDATTRLSGMRSLLEAVGIEPETKNIATFYDRSDNAIDVDALHLKLSKLAPAADDTGVLVNLAMKLNDPQLQAQLRVVDLLAKCLPACSNAAVYFKNVFSKGPNPRTMSTDACKIFGQLNTEFLTLEKHIQIRSGQIRWDTCFEKAPADDVKHIGTLDGAIQSQHVLVNLKDEIEGFLKVIREFVENILREKSITVRTLCPDWIAERDEDSLAMAPRWHQGTIAPRAFKENKK